MQDLAEDARANGQHFLYVRIPGDIQPLERGDRFEDPLDVALRESALGSVTGGGSQLGEDDTIEYCGIDVVTVDRARGIELVRRVMRECQCPDGSVIEEYLPEYREHSIWSISR
jgi:hypothetical protein